jgi:hypothetical protein
VVKLGLHLAAPAGRGGPGRLGGTLAAVVEAPDAADRAARQGYARVRAVRAEIVRLLRRTPFDREDPAALRALIDELDAALGEPAAERRDQRPAGGGASTRRLGAGWLDQKVIAGRWGPYLVYRYRVGRMQKMKYLGKVATGDR